MNPEPEKIKADSDQGPNSELARKTAAAGIDHKLHSGDVFSSNGSKYKLRIFSEDELTLKPSVTQSADTVREFGPALHVLKEAAQVVQKISDRLMDSQDGLTQQGIEALIDGSHLLSPGFNSKIQGYLIMILKEGSPLLCSRSCNLVPPCSRAEFEAEISKLSPSESGVDWVKFLNHIYDPIPSPTQGFYLFNSAADRARFLSGFGQEFESTTERLKSLFDQASSSGLSLKEWREYEETSRAIFETQKLELKRFIDANRKLSGLSNRIRIGVDANYEVSFSVSHYTQEFSTELAQLGALLRKAADLLPNETEGLAKVLRAQANWAETKTSDIDWGASLNIWVNSVDPKNVLDVNLCAEEKASHLGAKGNFHIIVSQFADIPESIAPFWNKLAALGQEQNVNSVMLNILAVGGSASYFTYAGEKLPDDGTRLAFKSMTFLNTANAGALDTLPESVALATGRSVQEVKEMAARGAAVSAIVRHEYGHTLGDHAEALLGDLAGSVEETNAQASALYLSARLDPDSVDDAIVYNACWLPPRRAQYGPTEQHSHSDIVLFEEYQSNGGVKISSLDGKSFIEVVDSGKVLETAFATAIKMRLWEHGIPSRCHADISEGFQAEDLDQDLRISNRAKSFMAGREDALTLEAEAKLEVEKYFSLERIIALAEQLAPVISSLPEEIGLPVIPTDRRMAKMVA